MLSEDGQNSLDLQTFSVVNGPNADFFAKHNEMSLLMWFVLAWTRNIVAKLHLSSCLLVGLPLGTLWTAYCDGCPEWTGVVSIAIACSISDGILINLACLMLAV